MLDQLAAWDRVPEKLKAFAVHLGVVTPWSAFDWGAMFMSTIEAEARSRALGDVKLEAGLKVAMIDLVAGLGLSTFEEWTTLCVNARGVGEILALLLSHAELGRTHAAHRPHAFSQEFDCEPAADIVERVREATRAPRERRAPAPRKARRLSRRARGRW